MISAGLDHRYFSSFDGTGIHYLFYESNKKPKANIVVVHGAGEYAERYHDFALFLSQHSFNVYVMDLRGYGKSGGERAYVNSFDDYAVDVLSLTDFAGKTNNLPVVLFGHSMGGMVVSHTVQYRENNIRLLCLSSPCFGLAFSLPSYLYFLVNILSRVKPKHAFTTKAPSEVLTHDEECVKRHRNDENLVRVMTARLFFSLNKKMRNAASIAKKITCPISIFQAGDDKVVSVEASKQFHESISHANKFYKEYAGFYHEIIQEKQKLLVYADMLSWIENELG